MAAAVIAVQDSIADKFIARLKEEADKLSIGNARRRCLFRTSY